ncbi:MAG: WecB/TagA/CpsF family glycosyltransferase [Hyphomicrobiales bacterium]|nr:WecB/TagA/CpsF family glycosyltransferase [Hyphomicrobiales bacterium]
MIDLGKKNILGVCVNAIDYEGALAQVIQAAENNHSLSVAALAVHGVMTGALDKVHANRLNKLDLVVPDGQPVRWALNLLHKCNLPDRCYGPTLTLKLCEQAAAEGLPVYFYGSKQDVIDKLTENLMKMFPALIIAGSRPSLFRKTTEEDKLEVIKAIADSGAKITFVGLGCPRQEVWAYEYQGHLSMPLIAVGAAFDFHAGLKSQAPVFMQDRGLEWLFRLLSEPTRLWKRYLFLNPLYLSMLAMQVVGLKRYVPPELSVADDVERWG